MGEPETEVDRRIYIPMAGHVLGLALKPTHSSTWIMIYNPFWSLSSPKEPVQTGARYAGIAGDPPLPAAYSRPEREYIHPFRWLNMPKTCPSGWWSNWSAGSACSSATGAPPACRRMSAASGAFTCATWRYFCQEKGVQQLADLKRTHITDYAVTGSARQSSLAVNAICAPCTASCIFYRKQGSAGGSSRSAWFRPQR